MNVSIFAPWCWEGACHEKSLSTTELATPTAIVNRIHGARANDMESNLKLIANSKRRYSK